MLNGYKFRLYPNSEQEQTLFQWIGCQRLIYNAKVQEDRYFRRLARRMVGTAGERIPVDQDGDHHIVRLFLQQLLDSLQIRNRIIVHGRCFMNLVGISREPANAKCVGITNVNDITAWPQGSYGLPSGEA